MTRGSRRWTGSEKESGGEGGINTHENGNACIGSPCRRAYRRHGWPPVSPLCRFSPTSSLPLAVSPLFLSGVLALLTWNPSYLLTCALRLRGFTGCAASTLFQFLAGQILTTDNKSYSCAFENCTEFRNLPNYLFPSSQLDEMFVS